jgi:hypothetical protein
MENAYWIKLWEKEDEMRLLELVKASPFNEKFNSYSRLKKTKHNFNAFLSVKQDCAAQYLQDDCKLPLVFLSSGAGGHGIYAKRTLLWFEMFSQIVTSMEIQNWISEKCSINHDQSGCSRTCSECGLWYILESIDESFNSAVIISLRDICDSCTLHIQHFWKDKTKQLCALSFIGTRTRTKFWNRTPGEKFSCRQFVFID